MQTNFHFSDSTLAPDRYLRSSSCANTGKVAQPAPSHFGVTEIVLSAAKENAYDVVLPMLAQLSRQGDNKWLTWVAPHGVSKSLLAFYGFELEKVRLIHTKTGHELQALLKQALESGTSGTVVAEVGILTEGELHTLEKACNTGNSRALLLRAR